VWATFSPVIIVAWFVFHSTEIWPNHPVVYLWAAMVGRQGDTRVGDKTGLFVWVLNRIMSIRVVVYTQA